MHVTTLQEGSLTLRPFTREDADAYYEAVRESVREVGRWLPWCHEAFAPEESRALVAGFVAGWDAGRDYVFAITDTSSGRLLGALGINHLNPVHHFANLWYWVRTSAAGRGVVTASTRLAARFAFEELRLVRLEIVVDPENEASRRVAEKVGAVYEGRLRNRLVVHGVCRDALMFSLVAADLPAAGQ